MGNAIEIKFNSRLYSRGSINTSIGVYADIADCRVRKCKDGFIVALRNFDETLVDKLGDEFANYVLFVEGAARSW